MKICIIGGGGAIGGYLAVLLANSGNEVTVMARGATLRAIEERGLALISDEHPEPIIAKVKAVENLRGLPKQDVIILAVVSWVHLGSRVEVMASTGVCRENRHF